MTLDILDKRIEDYRMKSGDYPSELHLTLAEVEEIKIELSKLMTEGWLLTFPDNYRGIKIRIKE